MFHGWQEAERGNKAGERAIGRERERDDSIVTLMINLSRVAAEEKKETLGITKLQSNGSANVINSIPVSYTHLDVYKRQIVHRRTPTIHETALLRTVAMG